MPGQITEIRRARADDSQIHRDVTISRDDRNALRDAADLIEGRFPILASNVRGVIEKWDANEATEILVTPDGLYSLDGIGERCACGRALDENGEHDGGYGAHCG